MNNFDSNPLKIQNSNENSSLQLAEWVGLQKAGLKVSECTWWYKSLEDDEFCGIKREGKRENTEPIGSERPSATLR